MDIPVIDLDIFIPGSHNQGAVIQECKKAAEALIVYGALVLHDSRVNEKDNAAFLDLMEDYFNQSLEDLRQDERIVQGYYVGFSDCSPRYTSTGSCPKSPSPPPKSTQSPHPNYRYSWHMNKKASYESEFPALNSSNVVPSPDFLRERWTRIMDQWGQSMKNAVSDLTDMIEIGLNLPPGTFKEAGQCGPHVLGPSSIDLVKHGQKGTLLMRSHSDVNFLTIHGRSRYPSLDIWTRNTAQRIGVEIPLGSNFFVQAGEQLEHITGGLIKACFHEVVVNDQTLAAIERRKVEFPDRPLIRVSSSLFWHLSPDYDLVPIATLKDKADILRAKNLEAGLNEGDVIYEPMKVAQQVRKHEHANSPA
jgi:isopenicillin N synthase-like dioxygenase